jgi:hypothetical protein
MPLWLLLDPYFQSVKAQSELFLKEELNAYMLLHDGTKGIDLFGFPEQEEYVNKTDIWDEPVKDTQHTRKGKRPK